MTIPKDEQWLYDNLEAHAGVQRGLKDAKEGRIKRMDPKDVGTRNHEPRDIGTVDRKPRDIGTRNRKPRDPGAPHVYSGMIVCGTYVQQVIPKSKRVKAVLSKTVIVSPRGFDANDHKSDPEDPDAKPEPNLSF